MSAYGTSGSNYGSATKASQRHRKPLPFQPVVVVDAYTRGLNALLDEANPFPPGSINHQIFEAGQTVAERT